PTKPVIDPSLPSAIANTIFDATTTIKSSLHYRNNNYDPEVRKLFLTLIDNPVFIHHKYTILTKYILMNPEIYRQLATKDVPPDYVYVYNEKEASLIDHLVD